MSLPQERSNEDGKKKEIPAPVAKGDIDFERDLISIIETNVDDVTGEILSHAIEKFLAEGAYDAIALPYLGKKGRQGFMIRIVCSQDSEEKLSRLLVEETGTLGVKVVEYTRLIVPRKTISVPLSIEGFHGEVSVKVARIGGEILRIKPEIAEATQIAESEKIPLRDVLEHINCATRDLLAQKPEILWPPDKEGT